MTNARFEKALKTVRLYMGSEGLSIKVQQRFYNRMRKELSAIAASKGLDEGEVAEAFEREARSRGVLTPQPGKDY